MRKEKGFAPIIILIAVVVIIAVLLFLAKDKLSSIIRIGTPVPVSTSTPYLVTGWKTYTSATGNTSIKYPSNWAYREFEGGVAFYPVSAGDTVGSEPITIGIRNKTLNDVDLPFAEYVKVAAIHEIQNYQSLSTISQVKTDSGLIGYKTTWKVAPIMGSNGSGLGDSLPITYFAVPNLNTSDIQVSLGNKDFLSVYEDMIKTVDLKAQNQNTSSTSNWSTYTNSQYHFEIKYPDNYKALTDSNNLYGWPDAVVLIYKGGQSYDLPIEVWSTKDQYLQKYPVASYPNLKVFTTSNGKFITLANVNKDPEVDQIISTFKFTQ